MKASYLAKSIIDYIVEYGDVDINIDLLTENQSNIVKPTGISVINGKFDIEVEIENKREFKKNII